MEKDRDSLCFFWDIQNCPVPSKRSPYDCVSLIRDAVFKKGEKTAEVGFNAYCDITTLSQETRQELSRARVHVRDVPSQKKGAADMCLQQDIHRHTMTHRSGIIVLISGDVDFAEMVHDLVRMGNYRVVLIHNKQARPELRKNATMTLKFEDVVAGKPKGSDIKVKDSVKDEGRLKKSDGKGYGKAANEKAPKVKGADKTKSEGKPKDKSSKDKIPEGKISVGAKPKSDKGKPNDNGNAKEVVKNKQNEKPKSGIGQRQPRQRKWSCPECEKTFAAEESLKQHVEMTGHAINWNCEGCGKSFQSESAMQQHKDATGHDQIVCYECGKEFASENSLAQHLEATGHCSDLVWACPRCDGETWNSLKGLLLHLQQLDAEEEAVVVEERSRRQPNQEEAQLGSMPYFKKWCHQEGGILPGSLEIYQRACAGDAASQYWIATCFATCVFGSGHGLHAVQFEALRWGLYAAEQGHVEAQWLVGLQYVKGEGAPKNLVEAERWLSLAARQGHAKAQAMLESVQREKLRTRDL